MSSATAPCGPGHGITGKACLGLEAAKAKTHERWSGATRNWEPVTEVHLNPGQQEKVEKETSQRLKKAA
jgi:hypothetical protein